MTREYVDPIIVDLPSLSSAIGVQISALREHMFAESRSGQDLARACKIVWSHAGVGVSVTANQIVMDELE